MQKKTLEKETVKNKKEKKAFELENELSHTGLKFLIRPLTDFCLPMQKKIYWNK